MALSCERHSAFVYDRGGLRQIVELSPLIQVKWERVRDTISVGSAQVAAPGWECAKALGLIEAGRHELVIFRGNRRVWEGPITRITYRGTKVELEAHDVMHYVNRTIMHNEYDNRYPNNGKVLDRVKRIMNTELARKEALDPPTNFLKYVKYLYVGDDTVFPGRYYDTIKLVQAVRASRDVAEINSLLHPMRQAYGFTDGFGVPGSVNTGYGFSYRLPSLAGRPDEGTTGGLKESVVHGIEALAKYPPEFFRSMKLKAFWFVERITDGGAVGGNIGGMAVDKTLFIDVEDLDSQPTMDRTIHHEFMHLMWTHFTAQRNSFTPRWQALNPAGFAYSTNYTMPPFNTDHPTGFIRDYARYSLSEDIAEVAGAVFSADFAPTLARYIAEDNIIARKVALYKEWLENVSGGAIKGDTYFKAVNEKRTITLIGASGVKDAGTAAHTLPHEMTVFEHVDNFAQRGGLDYTVVGRSIVFFDVRTKIGQTPMVTESDFLGETIITQYGMELATRVAHTDGKGHFGSAGGTDGYYGEWESLYQAYDEDAERDGDEPPSVAELSSQAQRTYEQSARPPLVVRVPDNTSLNPNGALTVEDLVPGVHIPLSAKLPGRTLTQMQKLDSMSVEETADGGEQIKVVLSPAPANNYTEEDEV